MNSKKILIISCSIVVLLIVGWYVFSHIFRIPVPETFADVYEFTSNYEVTNLSNDNIVIDPIILQKADDHLINHIEVKGKIINFVVARFSSGNIAGNVFSKIKKNTGVSSANLKRYKAEINLPLYGSYWTVTSKGKTYSMWKKDNWVVFIRGEDRELVKGFERTFKNNI